MLLKINKLSVLPLALIVSIFQACTGFILGAIVSIGSLFSQQEGEGVMGLGVWAVLLLPIINGVLGFVAGAFIAWFYNNIVKMFDKGIELDCDHLDNITLMKG